MASLRELLGDDGSKKREPRPLQGFADGEREFWNRAVNMPLIHHGAHDTTFLFPSAGPSPGDEAKSTTGASKRRLPGIRKSPAVLCWFEEDVKDIMPAGFGGSGNLVNGRLRSSRGPGSDTPVLLDEAATRALISILNDYIRCFFKDEDFRLFLRQKCYYCVRFRDQNGGGGGGGGDDGAGAKLGDAIKVIERSVQEFPADPADLRRSHAQLTGIVTAGSSSADHGGAALTRPARSSRLSACVHLYLSVICKMVKKDAASAVHLLQVFCDAPFEARSILLPDLWGSLLLPHLRHLKEWYAEEAEGVSYGTTPCGGTKMRLLKKVYSDALDKGTHQIADYYKGWVARGLEAPSYPSVCVPSPSTLLVATSKGAGAAGRSGSQLAGTASPRSPASSSRPLIGRTANSPRSPASSSSRPLIGRTANSPRSPASSSSRPLISRRLYESIFDRSREQGVDAVGNIRR